jgi:small subunit ribosomal protein S1
VRNVTSFGAFIDLGGLEGLLHVSDLAWWRVHDPHEVVRLGQALDVYVLRVERERGRVALSLKHLTPSPWRAAAEKYPVGSRHPAEVVNLVPYGAFVRLEPGVEGLVHLSEMSWLRRPRHPSEVVSTGDTVEVQVLKVNPEKEEISLGLKQARPDPWDGVADRYPAGTVVTGVVRNLTGYGAFVELEPGLDGLLHLSEFAVRPVESLEGLVREGDPLEVKVLRVDAGGRKIGLSRKGLDADPAAEEGPAPPRPRGHLRGGTGSGGPLP